MAPLVTYLSVLLLFPFCDLIDCSNAQVHRERQDRAPNIESSEHSVQYLAKSAGTSGSYFKKGSTNRENNASYRSQEHVDDPRTKSQTYNQAYSPHHNNDDSTAIDSNVDANIRSIFSKEFGPGLHIFKNTVPFVNEPHLTSHTDEMIGDQPDSYLFSSTIASSDKEFFKVQRGADGKLSLVYKEDLAPKRETNTTLQGSGYENHSSYNESLRNRSQTHFSGGLPLDNDKVEPTPQNIDHSRDNVALRTVDAKDCVENDTKSGKPFCTRLRNYPEKSQLEQIIKSKFGNLESFFGEDLVLPQNISQRMNNEPIEKSLCESRVRVIYPESGQNKDYNWLFIVNTENYKQGIRIEECTKEGEIWGKNAGLVPAGYKGICKQHYIYRSLVAYANETLIRDQFKMPSCCKFVLITVS